jgi:DNA-repair protein XRCC2
VVQSKPALDVPPLDRLLEVFCAEAQPQPVSGVRLGIYPGQPNEHVGGEGEDGSIVPDSTGWQFHAARWKPLVLELTSLMPASGKTSLLCYCAAVAVLPRDHGGQGGAVVWFDTDGRFSAMRLREVVLGIVGSSDTANEGEERSESLVQEALAHVHVFRPHSSQQLIDTLDYLPTYLLDGEAHLSMRRRLSLLILDSATAFYWQDRYASEAARFEHPAQPRDRPSRAAEVITRLKQVQKEFDCAIAYATSSPFKAMSKATHLLAAKSDAPRETTSTSAWTRSATLTLSLSRVDVPRFPLHMSLEECLRDREKRQDVVARGKFVAEVDRSGIESWTANVKEAWRNMEAGGSFCFSNCAGVIMQ